MIYNRHILTPTITIYPLIEGILPSDQILDDTARALAMRSSLKSNTLAAYRSCIATMAEALGEPPPPPTLLIK